MPLTAFEEERIRLLQAAINVTNAGDHYDNRNITTWQGEIDQHRLNALLRDNHDLFGANQDQPPTNWAGPPTPGYTFRLTRKKKPTTKFCKRCKNRQQYCGSCGEPCGICCGCVIGCDVCRIKIPYIKTCRDCHVCRRHCKCSNSMIPTKVGKINHLGRPLGVEFEFTRTGEIVYNRKITPTVGHWEHDATITPEGKELVVVPASGDTFIQNIHTIAVAIEESSPQVNESCGFHVHVQSGDLNAWELRRLIYLWCRIEPDVYRYLVAPHRLTDEHCLRYSMPLGSGVVGQRLPWQYNQANCIALMRKRYDTANKIKVAIIKKLYQIDIGEPQQKLKADDKYRIAVQVYKNAARKFELWKGNKRTPGQAEGGGCRYASMNLHSHFHRGTVEFRLKEGTITPEEFVMWPLFCGWFVESISKLTDAQVQSISGLGGWCDAVSGVVQDGVVRWVRKKMLEVGG